MDESIDDTFVSLGAGHGDVPTTVQAMKAGAVFTSLKLFSDILFPLSPLDAAPPVLTTNLPVEDLIVADPDLKLPPTYQWNIAVEQSLGSSQSLSLTSVGALGRDLLRQTALNPAAGGKSNFVYVYPIDNHSEPRTLALRPKKLRRHMGEDSCTSASYLNVISRSRVLSESPRMKNFGVGSPCRRPEHLYSANGPFCIESLPYPDLVLFGHTTTAVKLMI